MKKFKNFALKLPFLFGIVLLLLYAILTALVYPVHYLFPETEVGQMYGDATAKFIAFMFFLAILWRFGWISSSGINRLGSIRIWPIVIVLLAYSVLNHLYAFTGSISITFPDPPLAIANLVFAFSTSLVEETMVRGLVLIAMILAWGSTKNGLIKAIALSSMLFGLLHLVNIIIRPVGVVLLQAVILTIPGILYAALVLSYKSLWPAIMIHWLVNASVNIKLIGAENYQEKFEMWVIFGITLIPVLAFSGYLIHKLLQNERLSIDTGTETLLSEKDTVLS